MCCEDYNFDEYAVLEEKDPRPEPSLVIRCLVCGSEFTSEDLIADLDFLCWKCPCCLQGHTINHELTVIDKGAAYDKN